MSYTPEEQQLSRPLEKAANALEELAKPIRERLKHPEEWRSTHLEELALLLRDVADIEARLRVLASQVS